uniref:Uncharacterized protein n=1 Tax=Candidatus Methanophagaceae archaeon ANME-1 ERB6 TaxID=2759912 RepID=A0A7G9YZ23_9EURY|nr:hypothetical protein BKBCGLBC_00018 [Methanosarcinales archaeon ANME-1 ERB6]
MEISRRHIAVLIVVGVFLTLVCVCMSVDVGVSATVTKQANLQESTFVVVTSSQVKCDKIDGMVKNNSEVSISVVLTNFSKEIEGKKSELFFHSDLENPVWGISIDGSPKECRSPFTIDHRKVGEARITLTGKAPEVKSPRKENVTLLKITQKIKKEYLVVDIKRDVTSEIIESAIIAMNEAREKLQSANWTIANATEKGIDVSEADENFGRASLHLENAQRDYWEGWSKESIEEATNASYYAELAKQKAESAVGAKKHMNYGGLAVVAIIAIVVIVLLNRQRQRKRGVY